MDLKTLRQDKNWSQEQLAEISGVSVRTIQRVEKGENPGTETLKAIAAAFDISVAELQKEPSWTEQFDEMRSQLDDISMIGNGFRATAKHGWKGLFAHIGVFLIVISWILFLVETYYPEKFEFVGIPAAIWLWFMWEHLSAVLVHERKGGQD